MNLRRAFSLAERNQLRSRRSFLVSAGATAASLPFLRALPGYAQADAVPKLVLMFSGCGRIRHLWGSDVSTGSMQFRQNLAPLQPYAEHITILEGIYAKGATDIGGTHEGGAMSVFTGAGGDGGITAEATNAGYPSIDTTFMAQQSGTAHDASFYQQIVGETNGARNASPLNRMIFDASGNRRDPLKSPWEAVDQYLSGVITGDSMPTGPTNEDLARTKLFDALSAQLGDLESRLCAEDYYQVQAMRDAIAQANQSMQNAVACELPALPPKPTNLPEYEPIWLPPSDTIDLDAEDDWYFLRGKAAIDLLVVALGCGVTRAGVLQFDQAASEMKAIGLADTHHVRSHGVPQLNQYLLMHPAEAPDYIYWTEDQQENPPSTLLEQFGPVWADLSRWELMYAKQFAYLVGQLDQFGLIGDTAVLWGSEIDDGQHMHFNMPYVLASGDKLPFARGSVVRYPVQYMQEDTQKEGPPTYHNDLLRTVLNGVGVGVESVGAASGNQGPLDRLLA
jgi:hypothetical protein